MAHPWDLATIQKRKEPVVEKPKEPAGMVRNWYELSIPDLELKKKKMLDWIFATKDDDPQKKKMWKALTEVSEVLALKKDAENDPFLKTVIETLCM
jgi:hypothetical protein